MCRHYPIGSLAGHGQKRRFRNGPSYRRVGSCSHLINQKKALIIQVFQEVFHIQQLRGVSAQVVFERLLIPNVDHDLPEDAKFGIFARRWQQSALYHVLEETNRLKADRLSPGIGSRDHQHSLFGRERNILWHHRFLRLLMRQVEERMHCLEPL